MSSLASSDAPRGEGRPAPPANRLADESSPYLQQHASNPVDWYPWGEEAFARARAEDKPIFLSIGYSTCHWCHVMERESFEDESVAALLNDSFVCMKVDREERPDIDHVYMTVAQLASGSGGWPLTVIMTPAGKPFFVGTYFPKDSVFGRPGMRQLVPALAERWREERESLTQRAEQTAQAVAQLGGGLHGLAAKRRPGPTDSGAEIDDEWMAEVSQRAFDRQAASFDEEHGGFGTAPKFPSPHQLGALLRYWRRTDEPRALHMVETTLTRMREGGIYDQLGYGFHRYSTDAEWLVPHFEKMLYDQALLAMAHLETYQASGKPQFATTAREIFEYVLRDLTLPQGGFTTAEDADSEGREGQFYLWTPEQVREVLDEADAELVLAAYDVRPGGNFRDEASGGQTGESILHHGADVAELAEGQQVSPDEVRGRLKAARQKLFAAREQRPRPLRDDKILTDLNGLMIAALAQGARVLDEPRYAKAARRAAAFVLARMQTSEGRLLHRYHQDRAGIAAGLDDYAFFVWGLTELYETTFDVRYLRSAVELTDQLVAHFWDDDQGGFYMTPDDAEQLLFRGKEIYDGAVPSGNSVAAGNLLRLARLTDNRAYETHAEATFQAFHRAIAQAPELHAQSLQALDFARGPTCEVVVSGRVDAPDAAELLSAIRQPFAPNKVVLFRDTSPEPTLVELAPWVVPLPAGDEAAAFVCRDFACAAPTSDTATLQRLLTQPSEDASPQS